MRKKVNFKKNDSFSLSGIIYDSHVTTTPPASELKVDIYKINDDHTSIN